MGLSGNPLEDLKPSVLKVPPVNLPVIVPNMMKEDLTDLLPERGSGLATGRASERREGNPRNLLERLNRHYFG